jgi:hypothetical protein
MNRPQLLGMALLLGAAAALAQQPSVDPQVRNKPTADHKITAVELTAHFVTAIRVPEPVTSVVVGDPALFQVEHSEHEPETVFVKALTTEASESNLLISTMKGRQISILLVNHGNGGTAPKVDFLLRYQEAGGFLIEPDVVPFALVAQTTSLNHGLTTNPTGVAKPTGQAANFTTPAPALMPASLQAASTPDATTESKADSLDSLLERQKLAPLPALHGEQMERDEGKGARLRAGISEVLDGGQQVIVLFCVINTSKHPILLMPPQIQLGGRDRSGKLIKRERWSTAEQLPVMDSRLSKRRIAPGERADGVVLFERPPYKRSSETLFLQMAESGAVDKPALAPIGFGVSTLREAANHEK